MESKIWSEFQCTKQDGSFHKFSVQDCTEDQMKDVIDIYSKYFTRDESIQKLSGVAYSEDAQNECKTFLVGMLREEGNHVVVCVEESTGKVVGVSCMKLYIGAGRELPDVKPQTKEVTKLFEILRGMSVFYDVAKNYSVDKWYGGRGIIVHPEYRGFGVGSALVQSRRKISTDHGVPITSAWMTSIGTQKAAHRDGWETAFEIDSREFAQHFGTTPYDGIAPTFKVMVGKP